MATTPGQHVFQRYPDSATGSTFRSRSRRDIPAMMLAPKPVPEIRPGHIFERRQPREPLGPAPHTLPRLALGARFGVLGRPGDDARRVGVHHFNQRWPVFAALGD